MECPQGLIDFFTDGKFFGFVGGMILSFYNLVEAINLPKEDAPDLKSSLYWVTFFFWPLLGFIFVFAYQVSGNDVKGIVALQIGLTSPLILKGMISGSNKTPQVIQTPEGA